MVLNFNLAPIELNFVGENTDAVLQNCTFSSRFPGKPILQLKDNIQLRMANCVFALEESSIYLNDTVSLKVWNVSYGFHPWHLKSENVPDEANAKGLFSSRGNIPLPVTETPYASGES